MMSDRNQYMAGTIEKKYKYTRIRISRALTRNGWGTLGHCEQ